MKLVNSIELWETHMNRVRKANSEELWYLKSFKSDFRRIYNYKNETAKKEVAAVLRYAQLPEKIEDYPSITVLDLCCGWGRHALEFASRGYDVTGIDISDTLLEIARRNAAKAELRLKLMKADMRNFSLPYKVKFVVNLWTSFGYFTNEKENRAVLENVWNALEPGGAFILDLDNLPYFLNTTGKDIISVNSYSGTPVEVLKSEMYIPERSRRVVTYRFLDPRKIAEEDNIYLECRLYLYEDIRDALMNVGFQVNPTDKWGDFGDNPLTQKSPRMIVLARKPST